MRFYPEHETIWGYKKRLEFLLSQIQSRYGKERVSILDVGCGNGSMMSLPLAEQGYTVTGIDLDEHSIQKARETNPFHNATFLVAKTKDLLGNQYDVVICSEVLEHIEDYEPVILDLRRLCKPEGIVFITVPNGYGPFEIDSFLAKRLKQLSVPEKIRQPISRWIRSKHKQAGVASTENIECPHVHFFTMKHIRQSIERYFEITCVEKSVFACGPLMTMLFGKRQWFVKWNLKLADKLPPAFVSGWYFSCKPKREEAPEKVWRENKEATSA